MLLLQRSGIRSQPPQRVTSCNSSSKASGTLFWTLWIHAHTYTNLLFLSFFFFFKKLGPGEMAHWVKAPATKPDGKFSTWYLHGRRKPTHPHNLSSDLHVSAVPCSLTPCQNINKCKAKNLRWKYKYLIVPKSHSVFSCSGPTAVPQHIHGCETKLFLGRSNTPTCLPRERARDRPKFGQHQYLTS